VVTVVSAHVKTFALLGKTFPSPMDVFSEQEGGGHSDCERQQT